MEHTNQNNKGLGTMDYQQLFNQTLKKMRYATSGVLVDNEPLMKALVKIMYDFSDALQANNIIQERTIDNGMDKDTNGFVAECNRR